jgi:hypothetical protein
VLAHYPYDSTAQIQVLYEFHQPTEFFISGAPVSLGGPGLLLSCSEAWVEQLVQEDVSLGLYDHLHQDVIVPDQQAYSIGWFDLEK